MTYLQRTTIRVGNIDIDAYTANEPDPNHPGAFINYLSGRQMADVIGNARSTVVGKSMSKELKTSLGEDFTVAGFTYKMASGGTTKVNAWNARSANIYWRHYDKKGNPKATALIDALSETTLDIIINDAFGRKYVDGYASLRSEIRENTKVLYKGISEATDRYYVRVRGKNAGVMHYVHVANAMNNALFGKTSKVIRAELELPKTGLIRDSFGIKSLKQIEYLESLAITQIDKRDKHPWKEAIPFAVDALAIMTMDYTL